MYLFFFLLSVLLPVKAKTEIYDVKMTATANLGGLEISFRLNGDTTQLNGDFKVEHEDCGGSRYCSRKLDFTSIGEGSPIRIQTVLDPCSSHTGIKIKAGKFKVDGGGVISWTRNWDAVDCKDNDTKILPEVVGGSSQHNNNNTTCFFTENHFQNSIVLGVVLLLIIAIAATLAVSIMSCKKRAKENREDVMKMEENQVYGTYEDGPMYNVVTDENAYYGS